MPENHGRIKAPSRDDVYGGEDGYGQYEWLRDLAATANLSDLDAREKAALALTVAENMIVHGTTPPDSEGSLWVDTGDDAAGSGVSWDDLTGKPASFPPTAHTHDLADVDGLADRLAALERDTGWRNVPTPALTAGKVLLRRIGRIVYMTWDGVVFGTLTGTQSIPGILPAGFRSSQYVNFSTVAVYGPALGCRTHVDTAVQIFGLTSGAALRTSIAFPSTDPFPTTLPGTPA